MNWTPVEDAIVRTNRGILSSREIAAMIGRGLTRNAVVGRAKRLGLVRLQKNGGRPCGSQAKRKPPTVIEPAPMPVEPLNIPFIDLERKHCREIVGSAGPGMSLSCGHKIFGESSYCRWHYSINYTKPEPRKVSAMRFAA